PAPAGSLLEYLAIRLILERFALQHTALETLGYGGPLSDLREVALAQVPKRTTGTVEQRTFQVFQLAQALGWTPRALHHLSKAEWVELVEEIESFTNLDRRRVFHEAYER